MSDPKDKPQDEELNEEQLDTTAGGAQPRKEIGDALTAKELDLPVGGVQPTKYIGDAGKSTEMDLPD